MRRSIILSTATVLFALPLCVSLGEAAAQALPRYQITDLGTLGGDSTIAAAINASGQVTGTSQTHDGFSRAFFWDGAFLQDLGTLGGDNSHGTALNDIGQVTGISERTEEDCTPEESGWAMGCRPIAFLWKNGEMVRHDWWVDGHSVGLKINSSGQVLIHYLFDMGAPLLSWHDFSTSYAPYNEVAGKVAINDAGKVTGTAVYDWQNISAFIWDTATDEVNQLGAYFGLNTTTQGVDINAAGQVAGDVVYRLYDCPYDPYFYSWVQCDWGSPTHYHAMLWFGDSAIDLGTLGGTNSFSVALNDSGQVVGSSQTAGDSAWHAFLWSDGTMYDLGTLGGTESRPVAINNAGIVTGFATTEGDAQVRAFVWDGSSTRDLNQLIADSIPDRPLLWQGEDINDAGQILASGYSSSGKDRAYVLTPISLLLSRLLDDSIGVGPGKALERRVENAITYYDAEDLGATCSTLEDFVSQADGFASKRNPKVPPAEAQKLIGEAYVIHAALGCP